MSGRSRSTSTWLRLLDASKSQFIGHGCDASSTICSQDAFRTAFEQTCKDNREKFVTRLWTKLIPSYGNITEFVDGVSEPVKDLPPDGLAGLIWGASFATIKASVFLMCERNITNLFTERMRCGSGT